MRLSLFLCAFLALSASASVAFAQGASHVCVGALVTASCGPDRHVSARPHTCTYEAGTHRPLWRVSLCARGVLRSVRQPSAVVQGTHTRSSVSSAAVTAHRPANSVGKYHADGLVLLFENVSLPVSGRTVTA